MAQNLDLQSQQGIYFSLRILQALSHAKARVAAAMHVQVRNSDTGAVYVVENRAEQVPVPWVILL